VALLQDRNEYPGIMENIVKRYCLCILILALHISPGAKGAEEEKKFKINLAALDLMTFARQVEKITKRNFIFDENQLRNVRVTLQSETPINADEFYRVFQTVLQMNDLALIPVEGAGIALEKVVKSQVAFKEPGVHPVVVQGEALPDTDNILSYLIKLRSISPAKALAAITPSLSTTGSVLQIPNTDLIIVNDVGSSLKRVEKILSVIDVPSDPVQTASVTVQNVSVEHAFSMISEYQLALGKNSAGDAPKDRLAIIKDERLNLLHLIGPEKDVKLAQAWLQLIDKHAPGEKRSIRYYRLKNVAVKDIVDHVGQLLGLALVARNERPAPQVPPIPQPPAPLTVADRPGMSSVAKSAPIIIKPLATSARTEVPADLIPVEGLNMLVVAGDDSVHDEVESILANLDLRKSQVLIEVAIVQVTGDEGLDLGVEGLGLTDSNKNRNKADFGSGFGVGNQNDTQERGFPTETTLDALTGGAFRFVKGDQFQVILAALGTKSNVSIVSQPLLLVNDNEEASFTTKVSEPTTVTSQTGGNPSLTSFGGFADATTALKITPHISPDGYLNLEIVQTFEEFTGLPRGSGVPPPKVANDAATKVTIPDRQTIVIGGFTRDSSTDGKTGIPGLMRIPGVGHLFSRDTRRKTISRLYLFVRPKILATVGFEDLKQESDLKRQDVNRLSKDSRIKKEIKSKIGEENPRAEIVDDLYLIEPVEKK
jgi:general secretion pathway protein D